MWWQGCSLALLVVGCKSETPPPTRVDDPTALVSPSGRTKSDTPFIDPDTDPPPPRSAAQLDPTALKAAVDAAQQALREAEIPRALVQLQKCINRTPPSAVCEGLYAATLLEQRKQRAWARHYLHEAVTNADASVPDELLRRLGRLAANNARFEDATRAFELLVGRGAPTADDYADLAHALQADESHKLQAVEVLEKAYALAPNRHDLLLERATLTARHDRDGAIALFEQYKAAVAGDPTQVEVAERRIANLRAPGAVTKAPPI